MNILNIEKYHAKSKCAVLKRLVLVSLLLVIPLVFVGSLVWLDLKEKIAEDDGFASYQEITFMVDEN